MRGLVWGLVVVACVLAAELAHAEDEPSEQARKREASAHFERAVTLYGDGDREGALIEFERAYQAWPDYRTLYNLAHMRTLTADYLGAIRDYERYLAEGRAAIPEERRDAVTQELSILRARVARVVVSANKAAKLFIDDAYVGALPLPGPIDLNVGRHVLRAEAADGSSASATVSLAGNEERAVTLSLRAPDRPSASVVAPKKRTAAIVTTSMAGALAAATVTVGILQRGAVGDLDERADRVPTTRADVDAARDRARALSIATDALGVATVGAAVAATWLWLRHPGEDRVGRAQATRVSLGLSGVTVAHDF